MASTYLTRTPSGAGTNSKIFTLSVWIKRCGLGADQSIMGTGTSSGYSSVFLEFNSNDKLRFAQINAQGASPAFEFEYVTTRVFRDVNAWYHIVCTVDSTDSTEADRVKIYVNGVRETSFSTTNHAGSNSTFLWNDARVHSIGRHGEWSLRYQNGVMSHIHNIDGTAYQASTFGSTDSTTGEWKINTSPSVTYGTNGFFILKDGNSVTDQSGNSNNFTVGGGTLTKTEDCPSNVFSTMNPLQPNSSAETFSNGNNTLVSTGGGSWTTHYGFSTLAMGSGKYYVEMKADNTGTSGQSYPIGLIDVDQNITSSLEDNGLASIRASSGDIVGSSFTNQTGLTAISAGDILAIAYDGVNGTLQFYRNGSTHGTAITGIDTSKNYYVACDTYEGSSNFKYNFGNSYFGSTAISSEGTNASGIGKFEYDVPTGYTALSTKGLNE